MLLNLTDVTDQVCGGVWWEHWKQ